MRMTKRINPKTGNEEPLRSREQILKEVRTLVWKRIRHGAPMIQNEEIILIYEALEYLLDWHDDHDQKPISDLETSGTAGGWGSAGPPPNEHSK